MPAPKRMMRGGGDLPRNPANLKTRNTDAAEVPQEPTQLELVPGPPEEQIVAPAASQSAEGIVITIKSNKLKESNGKSREGKPPVYRSVTGKDAGGKTYWLAIEMEDANPQKGEQWVVQGRERKPFGKEDNPLYPIDVTSFKPFEEVSSECANVPATSDDTLVQTMKGLLKQHNLCGVLQALTDALKE